MPSAKPWVLPVCKTYREAANVGTDDWNEDASPALSASLYYKAQTAVNEKSTLIMVLIRAQFGLLLNLSS